MQVSDQSSNMDVSSASAVLGMPLETVEKFRRVLEPDLSFEEHDKIFPLDLGPIWNLAAFSATKRIQNNHAQSAANAVPEEWAAVYEQFSLILKYGLMEKGSPLAGNDGSFLYRQTVVEPNQAQVHSFIHADGGDTISCFKETWQPPVVLNLIARDVAPLTIFIKGFEQTPWHLVDHAATHQEYEKNTKLRQQFNRELGLSIDFGDNGERRLLRFYDEKLVAAAEEQDKLLTFPEGHIIAFTDRNLHAGRPAVSRIQQNWARAETTLAK